MYLVTGASGHFGQAAIAHLLDTYKVPPRQIIAATREPGKLAALAGKGVDVRAADFDDPASLATAFAGAKRMLLISTNALEGGQRLAQHLRAVAAAEKASVEHIVYTSLFKADQSKVSFAPDHLGTEKAIAAAKLRGWTILRNNWYFENLFMGLPQALKSGTQYSAAGQGRIAHAARDDLARAAAAVLSSASNNRKTYELSGPREYTTEEIAAAVSKATGKPLAVVHVTPEAIVQGMVDAGLAEVLAKVVASFDVNTAAGGLSGVTGDLGKLIGKEPRPFEAWLNDNARALAA
jgi:NAD(P)H dehydrogenase (quinone)